MLKHKEEILRQLKEKKKKVEDIGGVLSENDQSYMEELSKEIDEYITPDEQLDRAILQKYFGMLC